MRVRVYNPEENRYFVSAVYGILNAGIHQKYIVLDPKDQMLCAAPGFADPQHPNDRLPLVDEITFDRPAYWIHNMNFHGLPKLAGAPAKRLDRGERIPAAGFTLPVEHLPGWNYVESQADAEALLDKIFGFHDSILNRLNYTGGGWVDDEQNMHFERVHLLTMHFDSQWSDPIELVFEGLIDLHLAPAPENYLDLIYGAELWMEDETLWLAIDSERDAPRDDSHDWVHALSLRWRFVPKASFSVLHEYPRMVTDAIIDSLSARISKNPALIDAVLAPHPYDKSTWENKARIIANQSDEILEHYAAGILNWLQDLNWPGSMLLFERLKKVRPGRLDRAIDECIEFAENVCRDEEWADFLRELQSERIKI